LSKLFLEVRLKRSMWTKTRSICRSNSSPREAREP
jgi:hypothetical protein